MKANSFAQVAIDLPIKDTFDYIIPSSLSDQMSIGKRVLVPFGTRRRIGIITELTTASKVSNLKQIISVLDNEPVIDERRLKLTKWISEYYLCSHAEAMKASLPLSMSKRIKSIETPIQLTLDMQFPIITKKNTLLPLELNRSIDREKNNTFLLKYKSKLKKLDLLSSAISKALSRNKSCIFLVPEISYINEYFHLLTKEFGNTIAILHSGMRDKEQLNSWARIKEGSVSIALGTRMAVFSPFKDVGLVIVDDEHDHTYKSQQTPRIDTVDVAVKLSELTSSTCIMTSFAPRLDTYYKAKAGVYNLLKTKEESIKAKSSNKVKVVDMEGVPANNRLLSMPLQELIKKDIIKNKNKGIILLNRLGFSRAIRCLKCDHTITCANCSNALIYHFDNKTLKCHRCSYEIVLPERCPKCNSPQIKPFGFGVEKIESEIARLFPELKVEYLDSNIASKADKLQNLTKRFKRGHVDLLVGTTVALEFLRYDFIRFVGIISLDNLLNLPDFRSSEKLFNLLMQISTSDCMKHPESSLLVQTNNMDSFVIDAIKTFDYNTFYRKELEFRKEVEFPPFCHIANITIRAKIEGTARKMATSVSNGIIKASRSLGCETELIGPSPNYIKRVRGLFIWNIILKASQHSSITKTLNTYFKSEGHKSKKYLTVDIDPR